MSKCKRCFVMSDGSIKLCYECLEARIKELETALMRIDNWAKAYPLKVFPEPDFKKVAQVLKAAGMSLDAISASNMRHVINGVKDIVEQAQKGRNNMEDRCFYCNDTGYIHTEDDIPDQMCPNCEIGQAVIKGYNAAIDIGIQARDTLREAKTERIKELEAALQKYGEHQTGCNLGDACICGLNKALKG